MADTDHVAGPGDDEEERLLRLGSYVVADGLLRLLAWLAPVIVLVVLGLVISSAASTETTGPFGETTTEFNDRGMWTALLCFSLAALCFFGRGTL